MIFVLELIVKANNNQRISTVIRQRNNNLGVVHRLLNEILFYFLINNLKFK
jgi:hypothetical protein